MEAKSNFDISNNGSWTSLLIGGPIGVIIIALVAFVGLVFCGLITQEGMLGILIIYRYRFPVIAMTSVFLISLWFTGRQAEKSLRNGQKLILTSIKYSAITNAVIWTTFIIVDCIVSYQIFDVYIFLLFPLILAVISTTLSTFTVGLLICFMIRKRIST